MTTFPEDFCRIESGKLRLVDGRPFVNNKNIPVNLKLLACLLGLHWPFWRKKTGSEKRGSPAINKVKEFVKELDFSSLKETTMTWTAYLIWFYYSWALWVKNVVNYPSERIWHLRDSTPTTGPSTLQAYQRKISGSVWWGFWCKNEWQPAFCVT